MTDATIFASYPVYRALPERLAETDRDLATKEVAALLDEFSDRITVRGVYSTAGFRAGADLMLWLVSESADHIQDLQVALRRTQLGHALEQTHAFLGLVRPAEFAPDHQPAFVQGRPPRKYVSVYPFVRTPEWYLLPAEERATHLRSHGVLGREYPDIEPNTTSAFGLGDYEWVLAFEADALDRLVELIRHLRANESRRYVKEETPFVTGIRKDLPDALADLPF
ncbi:MAG TPA: hydrogen peroxide-dependent heme synthase [Actinomycetota bacterium]|nr:hydrogen peroxide-dependent heme synthase [Actinomycetota bacterium]